jgi:hypothetical protein
MSDSPLSTCDRCGGDLRKKMFPVGIAFKGSGFYVNDYAAKKPEGAKAESDAKPADAAPKSDSAPAASASATSSSESKVAAPVA